MPLDATIGGVSSNSYITLEDAKSYFDERLRDGSWYNASDGDQEKALLLAAKYLERYDYAGYRANDTQAMKWPRLGVEKPDTWTIFEITEIPQQVKDAQCELALSLLGSNQMDQPTSGSIQSLRIGPVAIELKGQAWSMPPIVGQLLRGLRIGASGVPMVRA